MWCHHNVWYCACRILTVCRGKTEAGEADAPLTGSERCHRGPHLNMDSHLWSAAPTTRHRMTTGKQIIVVMQTHTWQVYQAYLNRLENTCSPRQTWWWTFVSAGFRWPSTSPAASPACDLGCCSIPCHKRPLPCRSQPPSPWKFHPTWKQKSSGEREHLPVSSCSNTSLSHAREEVRSPPNVMES